MYTNVPVGEAIEIALKELYSSNISPEIPRSAMESSLELAVANVHFKGNGIWYVQLGVFTMSASLAVILENMWIKIV